MAKLPHLNFQKLNGIVPAVVQDSESGEVLMLAFMNQEALERTVSEGIAYYFSRSRGRLWKKGERSGNIQHVLELWVDCEDNSVLLKVRQEGGASCHTGYRSCFHRRLEDTGLRVVGKPVFDPATVYGTSEEE